MQKICTGEKDIQHVGLEERTRSKLCHHRKPDVEYNTLQNSLGNPVSCWVKHGASKPKRRHQAFAGSTALEQWERRHVPWINYCETSAQGWQLGPDVRLRSHHCGWIGPQPGWCDDTVNFPSVRSFWECVEVDSHAIFHHSNMFQIKF